MYTLEQLQGKSLTELKEIGQQLNVSPGDRRRRQSWVDAIPGVNPPLLAMLEASPVATASVIEHEQAEPIVETAKASSVAEIEEVQEPIESKFGRIVYPRPAAKIESQMSQSAIGSAAKTSLQTNAMNKKGTISQKYREAIKILPGFAGNHQDVVYRELKNMNYRWDSKTKKWICPIEQMAKTSPGVETVSAEIQNTDYLDCPSCGTVRGLYPVCPGRESVWETRCISCDYLEPCIRHPFEDVRPFAVDRPAPKVEPEMSQSAIAEAAKNPPGVEVEEVSEAIAQAAKNSPGVDASSTTQLLIDEASILAENPPRALESIENSPGVDCVYCHSPEYESLRDKSYRCYRCQPEETDLNPILTGDSFSDSSLDGFKVGQRAIEQAAEKSLGVEVDRVQGAIECGRITGYLCHTGYSCRYVEIEVKCPRCGAPGLFSTKDYFDRPVIGCRECDYGTVKSYPGAIQIPVRETIVQLAEVFPSIGFDRVASTALRANIFELVPEPPHTDLFRQTIPFYRALGAYYDRYPCSRYRDGRHKINTKIFPGLPVMPGESDEVRPQLDRTKGADVHNRHSRPTKSDIETVGTSPGVEVDPVSESIENFPGVDASSTTQLLIDKASMLQKIIHTKNEPTIEGTDTQCQRASEVPRNNCVPSECDSGSYRDGAHVDRPHGLEFGKEGDRILAISRNGEGDSGRDLSRKLAELAPIVPPQAAIAQAAKKSPGVGVDLKIGMLVGRRSNLGHIGKILNIYQSRRGIWRAKIQPLNKSNFVYFDCAALIEQRLLYDYEMRPGGFVLTGEIFNKARCEHFEVFSRKQKPPALTNSTADELNSLSIFKLNQIARDMQIQSIPGAVGKRSLIRAILAEQAILQERRTAQLEPETGRAIAQKQKSAPPANKKKRAGASSLGNQLSLFEMAV